MIITRTPFRVSLAGGGTDISSFYKKEDGTVINFTIQKYLYVVARFTDEGFVDHKYRVNWSKSEMCNSIKGIKHPIVREALIFFNIKKSIEITTFTDIPSNTGLGSSSAFTVGLVHALNKLLKRNVSKRLIAEQASLIEIKLVKRKIGKQDHYASSFGGVNEFIFKKNEEVLIKKIRIKKSIEKKIENENFLFYTKIRRNSHDVLKYQTISSKKIFKNLIEIKKLTKPIKKILLGKKTKHNLGYYFNKSWIYKKKLSSAVTNSPIDKFYKVALRYGCSGGRLIGAGGGGFLLLNITKRKKNKVISKLSKLQSLPIKIDYKGTKVVFET